MSDKSAVIDQSVNDDPFWSEHHQFFTAQFSTYYTKPQKVWGRFHVSEEEYMGSALEIIPISQRRGTRSYVMMQPYVIEPVRTFTIGLYDKPKKYADLESPVGEVLDARTEGIREVQIGNAQAWYYHEDKTLVLWECFFDRNFRKSHIDKDENMQRLWTNFEVWLKKRFPKATTLATPFDDPIAETHDYQSFLKSLGYSPLAKAAFGKKI